MTRFTGNLGDRVVMLSTPVQGREEGADLVSATTVKSPTDLVDWGFAVEEVMPCYVTLFGQRLSATCAVL